MRTLLAAVMVLGVVGAARADDARPARAPASETSVPSTAPPATTKAKTGSHQQGSMAQKMNADAKKKIEVEGK